MSSAAVVTIGSATTTAAGSSVWAGSTTSVAIATSIGTVQASTTTASTAAASTAASSIVTSRISTTTGSSATALITINPSVSGFSIGDGSVSSFLSTSPYSIMLLIAGSVAIGISIILNVVLLSCCCVRRRRRRRQAALAAKTWDSNFHHRRVKDEQDDAEETGQLRGAPEMEEVENPFLDPPTTDTHEAIENDSSSQSQSLLIETATNSQQSLSPSLSVSRTPSHTRRQAAREIRRKEIKRKEIRRKRVTSHSSIVTDAMVTEAMEIDFSREYGQKYLVGLEPAVGGQLRDTLLRPPTLATSSVGPGSETSREV